MHICPPSWTSFPFPAHTVQWWFKKFCKGDEHLEDEECSGWPLEADNNQREQSSKLILRATWKVAEEFSKDHSMIIWHWKQIVKVKKLDKWVPHELTANQKKSAFWSVLLSYVTTTDHFLSDEKWIVYGNRQQPTQWLDWKEAPKHFPKPNLHQKKKFMVTVWWSAADLIHYSFLNLAKTI